MLLENLYAREIESQEFAETGPGEQIFMAAFEYMPEDSFPILEIGNDLDIRH